MEYIEAPDRYYGNRVKIFLAGGISDCPDWQQGAVGMLAHTEAVVYNPRRSNFPITDPEAAHTQIKWEFDALQDSDIVLFWFPKSPSVQPIALYELGFHLSNPKKNVVVGASPDYLRRQDIEIQASLVRGKNFPVFYTLTSVCDQVEYEISRIDPQGRR